MTTAHKPTFHPAVGTAHQGGFRYVAPRIQVSVRDLAAHTKLKLRQSGQNAPEEIAVRDLKKELGDRERKHFDGVEKAKQQEKGLLGYTKEENGNDEKDEENEPESRKPKVDLSQFDDADDSPEQSDTKSDNDDEDEEAELLRELENIKRERELEKQRKEQEAEQEEAKARTDAVLRGNPLMSQPDFSVKRRWDDDVVFKNQARDEPKQQKRFINDTIRSDFHRNFLRKYID